MVIQTPPRDPSWQERNHPKTGRVLDMLLVGWLLVGLVGLIGVAAEIGGFLQQI